jgi:hypothetical protein
MFSEIIRPWQAQTLFNRIGYTGEPHVFSMWCCLFADPAFKAVNAKTLEEYSQNMWKFAQVHRKKHKIWPHPAQAYTAVKNATLKKKMK